MLILSPYQATTAMSTSALPVRIKSIVYHDPASQLLTETSHSRLPRSFPQEWQHPRSGRMVIRIRQPQIWPSAAVLTYRSWDADGTPNKFNYRHRAAKLMEAHAAQKVCGHQNAQKWTNFEANGACSHGSASSRSTHFSTSTTGRTAGPPTGKQFQTHP